MSIHELVKALSRIPNQEMEVMIKQNFPFDPQPLTDVSVTGNKVYLDFEEGDSFG